MVTASDLIARGYFPRELPPVFTTEQYAGVLDAIRPKAKARWTSEIRLNLSRPHGLRRPLSIVHPEQQLLLADLVELYWEELSQICGKDTTALSRPVAGQHLSERAITSKYGFGQMAERKIRTRRRATHLVKADIAGFYDSIYTHSLEWMEGGRAKVKAALRTRRKSSQPPTFGRLLDEQVRNCQEGQTIGIPIGPDTSFILAEAILSSALQELELTRERAWRYSDDIEIACDSRSEAEDVLAGLQACLARYEFSVNAHKTSIESLPAPYVPVRLAALRSSLHQVRAETAQLFQNDAIDIMSRAIEYDRHDIGAPHVKFTLSHLEPMFAAHFMQWKASQSREVWRSVASILLGICRSDTSLLQQLDQWLAVGGLLGWALPSADLRSVAERICLDAAPRAHSHEVAWAIYIAARSNVQLSQKVATCFKKSSDQLIAVCAAAAFKWGVLPDFSHEYLEGLRVRRDIATSADWLLAYQGWRWGLSTGGQIGKDYFFAELKRLRVDFIVSPSSYADLRKVANVVECGSTEDSSGTTSIHGSFPNRMEGLNEPGPEPGDSASIVANAEPPAGPGGDSSQTDQVSSGQPTEDKRRGGSPSPVAENDRSDEEDELTNEELMQWTKLLEFVLKYRDL